MSMSNLTLTTTLDSPIGPLTLTSAGGGLTGLHMQDQRRAPTARPEWRRDDDAFGEAIEQLTAYFAGSRTEFDLPLDLRGTEFQRRVWDGLRSIPHGQTWSYSELAEWTGNRNACRAVGLANGANPISIVVPCHRVIGAGGSLTGYGGGLERKRWLLDHERSATAPGLFPSNNAVALSPTTSGSSSAMK